MAVSYTPSTIFNLLDNSETNKLFIPLYQRPYSWNYEVKEFLNDLDKIYLDNDNTSRHFIGLIVLCPHNDKIDFEYDIIDGQQRITTISILIAVLRDLLLDFQKHNKIVKNTKVYHKINSRTVKLDSCLLKDGTEILLETQTEGSKYESEFLEIILNNIQSLEPVCLKEYDKQLTNSKNIFIVKEKYLMTKYEEDYKKKNSFIAYKTIYEHLYSKINSKKDIFDKCEILINYSYVVLNNVTLMPFMSKNLHEAFTLFETLNDRGLELAAIDLIKNLCIKKAKKESERTQVHELWKNIFTKILENKDSSIFLRYLYISKYDFTRKNNLYTEYEKQLNKVNDSKEIIQFLNEMKSDAENFKILKNTSPSIKHEIDLITNVLNLLRSTKSVQWYSIGLALLRIWDRNKTNSNKNKLIKPIVEILENSHLIIISIILKKEKTNIIETFFPEISREIDKTLNSKNITEIIKVLNKKNEEILYKIKVEKLNLEFNHIFNFDTSRNDNSKLLLTYLRYKRVNDGTIFSENMTLEHVYPKIPNPGEWGDFEKINEEEKLKYRNKIGNHILLTSKPNKELQNSKYSIKHDKYIKIYKPEDVVKDIALSIDNNIKWTRVLIEKRTADIHDQLVKHLNIKKTENGK